MITENKITAFKAQSTIDAKRHRLENKFLEEYALLYTHNGQIKEALILRIYGTPAKNTACLWVNLHEKNIHASGSFSATGYGYHRPSEAAHVAFKNAGFEFEKSIAGRGESAIRDLIYAVAIHFELNNPYIHEANG